MNKLQSIVNHRIRPVTALRAMRRLIADPESTAEVFRIIDALKGDSLARAVARMAESETGRRMLTNKPSVCEVLCDREALRDMPADSLGRAYLDFVESQQLSADGLVAASEEAPRSMPQSPEEQWLGNRLRDIHDLQHVLTGYGRDELGELCLLSFMSGQTYNRGLSFIVFFGRRRFRQLEPQVPIDACVEEGRQLAVHCKWLPVIEWEKRLAEPLVSLRSELGLTRPMLYLESKDKVGLSDTDSLTQSEKPVTGV